MNAVVAVVVVAVVVTAVRVVRVVRVVAARCSSDPSAMLATVAGGVSCRGRCLTFPAASPRVPGLTISCSCCHGLPPSLGPSLSRPTSAVLATLRLSAFFRSLNFSEGELSGETYTFI